MSGAHTAAQSGFVLISMHPTTVSASWQILSRSLPAAGPTSQPDRARAPTAFPSERDAGSPHQSVRFCVSARHSPLVYFSLRNPHSKAVCAQCASNRPCRRIHSLRYHQHHARDPRPSRGALRHTESSSCVSAHSQTVKYRLCTEGKKV